jgi:hypothetical protein
MKKPWAVSSTSEGDTYVSDPEQNMVFRIGAADRRIGHVAGTGQSGTTPLEALSGSVKAISTPVQSKGVADSGFGSDVLHFSDYGVNRIRRIAKRPDY